tara:strand:+ start:2184 stop:2687 length:504 start_codon:yes stop_codon:yes gene_type:complete
MKEDNSKTYLVVGALLLVYVAGDKIFKKLGLTKTSAEQQADAQQAANYQAQLNQQYFDADYIKQRMQKYWVKSLTDTGANGYAEIIYKAKGIPYLTNDDEAAVYGVFKAMSAKTQVSKLSEVFFNKYKKDLKAYLQSFMSQDEFGNVLAICEKMIEGISSNKGTTWK